MLSGGVAPTDFESIQTVTVGGGGAAVITFSSIPSTYSHLQIRAIGRLDSGTTGINIGQVRFNSDSGNNYASHRVGGNGSTASATAAASTSAIWALAVFNAGELANCFGAAVIDILDYANTNKFKTGRSLFGFDNNGSGNIYFSSFLYQSTTAVSSLTITIYGGYTFAQYSQFALYGIKGS
jgi:hypothetical protein